jgi:hypothetical protein
VTSLLEQAVEAGELSRREVAELALVEVEQGLVEAIEGVAADGGEDEADDAAVVVVADAAEHALTDEAGGQSGDVGRLADELIGDAEAGGAGVGAAAEDAEDVVAGLGQAVLFEEPGEVVAEDAGGADEVEVGLLLGQVERAVLADLVAEAAGGRGGRVRRGGRSGHEWGRGSGEASGGYKGGMHRINGGAVRAGVSGRIGVAVLVGGVGLWGVAGCAGGPESTDAAPPAPAGDREAVHTIGVTPESTPEAMSEATANPGGDAAVASATLSEGYALLYDVVDKQRRVGGCSC